MENKKAVQLIEKVIADLERSGIILNTFVEDCKALREYVKEIQVPLAVKVLRYAYEHVEENEGFFIAIPEDEPILEDGSTEASAPSIEATTGAESLAYLIALIKDLKNPMNIADLKAYKEALLSY